MPARQRLTFAAIAVVIAIVAVVVLVAAGGSDDSSGGSAASNPTTPGSSATPAASSAASGRQEAGAGGTVVVVRNGQPVGGVKKISVHQGDQVRFTVRSDVADEIHVHGYDFHKDVKAGGSVSFSFPAKITGVFEAELEKRGTQIISLTVNP